MILSWVTWSNTSCESSDVRITHTPDEWRHHLSLTISTVCGGRETQSVPANILNLWVHKCPHKGQRQVSDYWNGVVPLSERWYGWPQGQVWSVPVAFLQVKYTRPFHDYKCFKLTLHGPESVSNRRVFFKAPDKHLNEAVVMTCPKENLAGDVGGHIMKQDFGIIPDDFVPVPLLCAVTLPEFSAPRPVYPDSSSSGSSVLISHGPPEPRLWEMRHSSSPTVWTKHSITVTVLPSRFRLPRRLTCHSLTDYWQKCPVVSQWSPQPWTSLLNVDISVALPRLEGLSSVRSSWGQMKQD